MSGLEIVGGIAAIADISKALAKVVLLLYQICAEKVPMKEDMLAFADDLQISAALTEDAHRQIQTHHRAHPDSVTLKNFQDMKLLQMTTAKFRLHVTRAQRIIDIGAGIKDMLFGEAWGRLRWLGKDNERAKIKIELAQANTYVTAIIQHLQYEVLLLLLSRMGPERGDERSQVKQEL
jgi:hypothetical protein